MHRAIPRLVLCCLVSFGALVSIKAIATPSLFAGARSPQEAPRTQPGPDEGQTPNRAAKADRLPLPDMRPEASVAQAAAPVAPVEKAPEPANIPPEPARTDDDDARQMAAAPQPGRKTGTKLTRAPPARRFARPHRTAEAEYRPGSKVVVHTLPCRQEAGTYSMLRALNLTPRCGA